MNYTKCPDFVDKRWNDWFNIYNRVDINNRISGITFNGILAFPTIFLNLLSVITIRKSSQLKNKLCYFVILMQSLVDLAVGAFSIPLFIFILALPLLKIYHCLAHSLLLSCLLLPPTLSIAILSTMTIERYIGVLHPYSYPNLLTKRRMLKYVGVWCLVYLGISILSLHRVRESEIIISTILLLHFLFILFAYTRIYIVVRRLDHRQEVPVDIAQDWSRKRRLFREIKHAKSCFIVVISFAMCLLPSGFSLLFLGIKNSETASRFITWLMILSNLNSCLNSIIFSWAKRLLRKEASTILNSILSAYTTVHTSS